MVLVQSGTPLKPSRATRRHCPTKRIEASGGAAELVVYEGEGHGFRAPDNQRDEYERTERFLAAVSP